MVLAIKLASRVAREMFAWNRFNQFRHSLAFRIIFSTVLLSLGVVWLTGSALYSQLSDGIRNVKIESSLSETRSAVFNAQYRLVLAQGENEQIIQQIIDDVVINSSTLIGTSVNGREVAFLLSDALTNSAKKYERTSNLISSASVPADLRLKVQGSDQAQWAETNIYYAGGKVTPGLAVGQKVSIPMIGTYEMYLLFSLENQKATLDLLGQSLDLTGLILTILIGLITWLVVRQVVRPVREAAIIAELFTAGDLNQRMQVHSKDELARLGLSFNEMADSLQKQITRLENLSLVQQRFVSDVSHELRTPLTTLRMASEVIHGAKEDFDSSVARSAELLVAQIDRFEKLLEDLLEVSRFDAEVAVLESVNINIASLVGRCVSDIALLAKERGSEIEFSQADSVIFLEADARRVERILRNLITNAIEYGDARSVKITIIEDDDAVAVGIRDYGFGMEESAALRVFDRFWRADPSRARTRGGTGLGLSIALEDARLHNGELEAWGRPGAGAHFVVTLPKRAGGTISHRLIALEPEDFPSTLA